MSGDFVVDRAPPDSLGGHLLSVAGRLGAVHKRDLFLVSRVIRLPAAPRQSEHGKPFGGRLLGVLGGFVVGFGALPLLGQRKASPRKSMLSLFSGPLGGLFAVHKRDFA